MNKGSKEQIYSRIVSAREYSAEERVAGRFDR